MISWFAGQRPPDDPYDPDVTGFIEPPETPAPIFAVRAFKHAIFGTPHASERRQKSRVHTRPPSQHYQGPPTAPEQSKRSNPLPLTLDVEQDLTSRHQDVMPSPSKGILMTPGTAAARRKTVSFGEHVIDNEGKAPLIGAKSGLSSSCPGKFPSPFLPRIDGTESAPGTEETRACSKLTEAFYQVRESASKSTKSTATAEKMKTRDDDEPTGDFLEPVSRSGRYWKNQYDTYVTNTKREMKKLVTKQRAAKLFARDKDLQCIEVRVQLKHEKRKVERLESRTSELSARLRESQDQLRSVEQERSRGNEEIDSLKKQLSARNNSGRESMSGNAEPQMHAAEQRTHANNTPATTETRLSIPCQFNTSAWPVDPRTRPQAGARPENARRRIENDIWTQYVASSPIPMEPVERPAELARSRTGEGLDGPNALQDINVNIMANSRSSLRQNSPPQATAHRAYLPPVQKSPESSPTSHNPDAKRRDSLDLSTELPQPSPGLGGSPPRPPSQHSPTSQRTMFQLDKNLTISIATSGPFHSDATSSPPRSNTERFVQPKLDHTPRQPSESEMPVVQAPSYMPLSALPAATHRALSSNSKENISPTSTSATMPSNVPHQTNSMPAKRLVSRDGMAMPTDRLAAAKARLEARKPGRVLS